MDLTAAWDVSDSGEIIVGEGYDPYGNHTAWIAKVSERIRVYGEFTGYIDDLYGPQAFLDEINIGTRFNCTFSYNADSPIVHYYGGPVYRDDSSYIECTFFGNTQEHNVAGSGFDVFVVNGTTDSFSFFNIDNTWNGLLAGYQVLEGGFRFNGFNWNRIR